MSTLGRIVIVEGNISAGKSTLTRDLASMPGFAVFLEPTVKNPFLTKFYADQRRYALKMQVWLLRQRFFTYIAALRTAMTTNQIVILDRSVFSDIVFAEKNRQDGNITEEGYQYYLLFREKLLSCLPAPQITLYLNVDPKICLDRVKSLRCRECEEGIPLNYLAGLDQCYKDFLEIMRKAGSQVVETDWSSFSADNVRSVVGTLQRMPVRECILSDEVRSLIFDRERVLGMGTLPVPVHPDAIDDEGLIDPDDCTGDDLMDESPKSATPSPAAAASASPTPSPKEVRSLSFVASPLRS